MAVPSSYPVGTPDQICPCILDICLSEAIFQNMSLNQPVYSQFNHERHLRKGGRVGKTKGRINIKTLEEIRSLG